MVDRYDKADIVAVIGMALASVDMGGMAPSNLDLLGEGGVALAALAILSNLFHKHKASIVSKIDSVVKRKTGIDLDDNVIADTLDKVADEVEDAVEDLLDDGELNDSNE